MPIRLNKEQITEGVAALSRSRVVTRKGRSVELAPAVVVEEGRVFGRSTYHAEAETARHVRRLLGAVAGAEPLDVPGDVFGQGFEPDASQREAVELAAQSGVLVLTGGPGVGKTTVAKALLSLYESAGLTVLCAAPTGKAAQRMREQTGREAATIHRLIGMVPGQPPRKNPSEPLECGVLVLDETSMVDVHLAAAVLAAVPTGARLLVIGDVDQLPSIGCGRVLHDLMASGEVPTARLTKIHRQASESRIPYVARDLNQGRCPDLSVKGTDVSHWETQTAADIAERVVRAVVDAIPTHKGISAEQVQVLAAQYDADNPEGCGVYGLNLRLQAALNPAETGTDDVYAGRGYSVRRGDRVIHTRNNYDLHVMNGEIGRVVAHGVKGLPVEPFAGAEWSGKEEQVRGGDENPDYGDDVDGDSDPGAAPFGGVKTATVDGEERLVFVEPRVLAVQYEDRVVLYTRTEARELELAYAISVHRSQGSQFPAVIVVCPRQHGYMLTRALVYTAVTRAEKFCLLVGEEAQIAASARNTRGTERRTTLQDRLRHSA